MKKYILALDEGTTSARAILFDRESNIISMAQHEIPQIYPKAGWVEQNPMDIYANQYSALTECIAKSGINADEIAAVGITNQRETVILWDRKSGKPIYNAIVWQCRRTADICKRLESAGYGDYIRKTTGLRIDPYFSGTKIKWILDNVDGAREMAEAGDLMAGTVDTWLIWKLTDGKVFVTASLDNQIVTESVTLPCLISVDGDINSPRLPSYKVKQTVTDDMVNFISFADFEDQDANHYGLNGSATQVERIFPPEKNTEKHNITGNAEEQTKGIFELIRTRKLI